MRTFFATCGALALMIPMGLLQSENTNAQDGLRRTQNQTIRPSIQRLLIQTICTSQAEPLWKPATLQNSATLLR
jgi:hypothetical protein